MSKDTEVDMKEVELNEMDPEKQPMTGDGQAAGGEKNGSVKVKLPEDEVTFTGLSKEELMKVAGTPGWVRTRWVLLILFWLGWLGMLAGAIVIIVQAPRCKPIPEMNWWNEGPIYQISDVEAFSEGLGGIEEKLDNINQLKVKGLVLGPLHTVQADRPETLDLQEINPIHGNKEALRTVIEKAKRKGISVVLDLTPNYEGSNPWFTQVAETVEKVKTAAEYWFGLGVQGVKVSNLDTVFNSTEWSKLQAAVQTNLTDDSPKRALIGVVQGLPASDVSRLVNTSGVNLILSDLLSPNHPGPKLLQDMDTLNSEQRSVAWGLGATQHHQLSKLAATPALVRLYQLLLFTMPGTPVFTYGDEIGLQAGQGSESPKMIWDTEEPGKEGSGNTTAQQDERMAMRKWFISLSDVRGKERSLLHGDYYPLHSTATSLSFLRVWDQSERFITAVNWGSGPVALKLKLTKDVEDVALPEMAKVKLSTDEGLKTDSMVSLDNVTLKPGQAVLLQFPF